MGKRQSIRQIVLLHGYGSHPKSGWFPWLSEQLTQLGYRVILPELPDSKTPKMTAWVDEVSRVAALETTPQNTLLIGHSLGGQAILRYLQETADKGSNHPFLGAIFVGSFTHYLKDSALDAHDQEVLGPWMNTPFDFAAIRKVLSWSFAIFSDNDPYIPSENERDFREELGSEILVLPQRGHFSGRLDGARELPEVLDIIQEKFRFD